MRNCLVAITETLSRRADEVESVRRNAFNKTEISMASGVVWSVSKSVGEVTEKVNSALDAARVLRGAAP